MATLIRSWPTYLPQGRALYQTILPTLAGGVMLGASLCSWLIDPLGKTFSAWQLPVDIGWQLRTRLFSYGLLCLCCACYAFFVAYLAWQNWQAERTPPSLRRGGQGQAAAPTSLFALPTLATLRTHSKFAGLLCLIPIGLFFTQYLFIDMGSMTQLAQHELQALFIQRHFGYHAAAQFIPIMPNTFDPSSLTDRFALLLDQIQPGLYLPFLSTLLLVREQATPVHIYASASPIVVTGEERTPSRGALHPLILGFTLLLVILGRSPVALACRFQAEHLLTTGNYAEALVWLNRAARLNPSLEQLSAYHIERGQAWYYLHPTQSSIESQAYLAAVYLTQNDYLTAYQTLMAARQQSVETPPWLLGELSITLTRLAEMQHPLSGAPTQRINRDLPAITWLNTLIHLDRHNVYGHYTLGSIEYDLHNFTACEKHMLAVIDLSSDPNILSSVYTYLSLSSEAQGNYVQARDYLFKAQDFDPSYRNNIAREEMSGLR